MKILDNLVKSMIRSSGKNLKVSLKMPNYLKQVVVRIEAPNKFEFANAELPKEIEKSILKGFPILEAKNILGKELQISAGAFLQKDLEKKEWHFFDANREKEVIIFENALSLQYKKYISFEILKSDWSLVINSIFNVCPETQVTRLGLRYINQIDLGDNRKKWKTIINEKLLQNFQLDLENISRAFSVVCQNNDGINTNFQYGIHNPDFPLPIKNNIFTLDYDVFVEKLLSKTEILENLDPFHSSIEDLFEFSTNQNA